MSSKIKARTYKAYATEAELGKSQTGNPRMQVKFTIEGGECGGHAVFWWGNFAGKAKEFTMKAMEECGWDGKDITCFAQGGTPNAEFGKKPVSIVVEIREIKPGDPRPQVAFVNAYDPDGNSRGGEKKMTKEEALAFASSIGQSTVTEIPKAAIPF